MEANSVHKERVVLPTDVRPSHYVLRLQPDLKAFTFSGEELITITVVKETNQISVNATDVKVSKVEFRGASTFEASGITYDEKRETVTFHFPSNLPVGEAHLHVVFTGELNDKLKGWYRSKYTNVAKEEAYMAVSQFEPTDARRAFPCWDEPALKARFDVTLVVPRDRMAISNMPVVSEKEEGDLKVVTFDTSPIMSTYLVCLIVGEFDVLEGKTSNGVLVRVFTPVGKREQGQFALEVAAKTLPFYDDYFGIPYPLPKADLVAIPDFAAGAMENWGCITYRETALLVDPVSSSAATRQWVALVVGHELAHQWFGNLVTMEWWTHLWLNEGFASWIEYLCVDHCFPEWDIWTQFVFSDMAVAFDLDSLKSTHPVEVEVGDPAEIDEIFDAISYNKGSSIIRMLAAFLGEVDFKKGLSSYLNVHKYANAATEDLWKALASASGKPVKELMDTWTKQDGYPVVTIDVGDDPETFVLTQERFLSGGPDPDNKSLWWVPVGVSSEGASAPTFKLFNSKKDTLTIPGYKGGWLKVNPGQNGFYRVKYSNALLDRISSALQSRALGATDRLGVQGDAFALAMAGELPTTQVLSLLEAYEDETDYTVWCDLSSNLADLDVVLSTTECYPTWRLFCGSLFSKIGPKLGWDTVEGESHLTALLRSLVIVRRGLCGHRETVEEAKKRFAKYVAGDEQALVPDLRHSVYRIALANGDESTFEAVLNLFRKADLHEEKERCMEALGSVKDVGLLKRTLEFALSDEVRSQDKVFVIARVSQNKDGREMAWNFVKDHWAKFHEMYTGGFLLSRLVKSTTQNFNSEEKAREVEAFFAEHATPAADRAVKQALERIRLNAAWLQRDGERVAAWLADWSAKQ